MIMEENEPGLGNPDNSDMPETNDSTETSSQSAWGELPDDDKKLVADKGWKAPQDALKSYREMEKLSGNKVSVPEDEDEESWSKLYARLGRPETSEGYELQAREADQPFMDGFKKACFESGLNPKQAGKLYDWYKSEQEAVKAKLDEDFAAQSAREQEELRAEWGDQATQNDELWKRGFRMLQLDEDALSGVELALGTKAFIQLGLKLGTAISEDSAKGLGTTGATKSEEMSGEDFFKELLGEK